MPALAVSPLPANAGCEIPGYRFNDDSGSSATMYASRNAVCRLAPRIIDSYSGDAGILSATVTTHPKLGKVVKATVRQFAYFPNKDATGDDYFVIDFRYDRRGQQHRTTLEVTVHNNNSSPGAAIRDNNVRMAQALSAAPSTCTGMELVCRSNRQCDYSGGRTLARICGGKFCDWEFEQCMKSGWWQTGRGVSRQVERR
jgi:hypothetical protein